MEYVYSALLLHSAKQSINEENIKKIVQSIGIAPDEGKVKALVASLEGVNIDETLQQATVAVTAPAGEEKKEEKKPEEEAKKAEDASAGLSTLFG